MPSLGGAENQTVHAMESQLYSQPSAVLPRLDNYSCQQPVTFSSICSFKKISHLALSWGEYMVLSEQSAFMWLKAC